MWAPAPVPAPTPPAVLFGKPVASVSQRVLARLVDGLVCLPFFLVLMGLEAILRAVSGVEASPDGDWVSSVTGFLMIVGLSTYDPVLTRLAGGATPGKRTQRLRIVVAEDGSPASAMRLWARSALLVLEWVTIVPGVIDLWRTSQDGRGRTWIDRAAGTAVLHAAAVAPSVGSTAVPPLVRPTPRSGPLTEPWAALVRSADAARDRFSSDIAETGPGPLRERLDDLERKVGECQAECFRIAGRGQHLAVTAAGLGLAALRDRADAARVAAEADPSDAGLGSLADAYADELESAERIDRLAAQTEVKLRQLVAELNSIANKALEVTMTPTSGIEFTALVDQLDGLRAALTEVEHEVGA